MILLKKYINLKQIHHKVFYFSNSEGSMASGYRCHLVNTDDNNDARWLTHLLRLNLLPTGYIYPKVDRAIRDL